MRNSGSKWGMVWHRTSKIVPIIHWTLVLLDIPVHPDIDGHVLLGPCFLNIRLKYHHYMEVLTSLFQWSDQILGDSTSLEVNGWSPLPLYTIIENAGDPCPV